MPNISPDAYQSILAKLGKGNPLVENFQTYASLSADRGIRDFNLIGDPNKHAIMLTEEKKPVKEHVYFELISGLPIGARTSTVEDLYQKVLNSDEQGMPASKRDRKVAVSKTFGASEKNFGNAETFAREAVLSGYRITNPRMIRTDSMAGFVGLDTAKDGETMENTQLTLVVRKPTKSELFGGSKANTSKLATFELAFESNQFDWLLNELAQFGLGIKPDSDENGIFAQRKGETSEYAGRIARATDHIRKLIELKQLPAAPSSVSFESQMRVVATKNNAERNNN